MNEAWRSFK